MKAILTISLALVLLISNIGFTLGTHYCCGEPVKSSISIGNSHLSEIDTDCQEKGKHLEAKVCCEDKYQVLHLEDDYSSVFAQTDHLTAYSNAIPLVLLKLLLPEVREDAHLSYLTPPPSYSDKNIFILVQSFLL